MHGNDPLAALPAPFPALYMHMGSVWRRLMAALAANSAVVWYSPFFSLPVRIVKRHEERATTASRRSE